MWLHQIGQVRLCLAELKKPRFEAGWNLYGAAAEGGGGTWAGGLARLGVLSTGPVVRRDADCGLVRFDGTAGWLGGTAAAV